MNPLSEEPFADLAVWLTTPAKSGVYLTRNEIVLLARVQDASLRLGERRRMLIDVLRSAQGPDELRATLDRLRSFVADSRAQVLALVARFDGTQEVFQLWVDRMDRTERRLAELVADLSAPTGGP